ncbi:mRNA-binding phosphate metabolism regulator LALA0_S01e15720g [Lachancea lanzarotensis]|uniref:LALA0S01e15720g1_1 n=1 Tax=Lachancea lanzarotensis TaxID=1245769 RepID=A0A0C7MTH8_9SACH|nr:uncharacterized protein LALA0_S01e15720g [Lachancea lanzarotensis]CEP60646.1 LALA0S01e15720g1_1 [Lachancea lanzarotensis]
MFNSRGFTTPKQRNGDCATNGQYYHEKTIEDSLKELEIFFGSETRPSIISEDIVSFDPNFASGLQPRYKTSSSRSSSITSSGVSSTAIDLSDATSSRDENNIPPFLRRQPFQIKVPNKSRFFVIKSNNADHIQTSIQNGVWTSTVLGNRRLSQAFRNRDTNAQIYLLYSVNGAGCFCGLAEMITDLRNTNLDFWTDSKRFKHIFSVRWIITQDIPNYKVRHFSNPLNEMKSVIQSRDTQEIPLNIGRSLLRIYEDHINSYQGPPFSTKTTYY